MNDVYIVDNHDMALGIWQNHRICDGTLIHVDAHFDYVTLKDCYYISIGNYLTHAVSEKIFRKVYWAVPDYFWKDSAYAQIIISQLPHSFEVVDINEKTIKLRNTEFPDSEFAVIGISNTNLCIDDFLQDKFICVDIDIDYMMNPEVSKTISYDYPAKSWCTATDLYFCLVPLLKERHIITIANSFYGGYTPLLCAYLSEYLYYLFCNGMSKKCDDFKLLEKGSDLLVEGDYAEAIKYYKQINGPVLAHLSAQIGLLYSYVSIGNLCDAKKVYSLIETHYRNYEAYYFPVSSLLLNKQLVLAKKVIEQWLQIANLSEHANLFYLKYLCCTKDVQEVAEIEKYASRTTDVGTDYEKSYVLGNIYLQRHEYPKSIDYFNSVLVFLRNNRTPIWCGQISSYEECKNHGIIISDIYEKLMNAYIGLENYKTAKKYAKMCMIMGRFSSKIEQILSF